MKRSMPTEYSEQADEYQLALAKVSLVDRNATPNGYQLLNSRRVGHHAASDIIALATEIQNADAALRNTSTGKLSLILDQIRFLQMQAQKILDETKRNQSLHAAACNFRKVPGKMYHLYERESDQTYFSMLSPSEWGSGLTHKYRGSYRLESDQSWTPLEHLAEVDEKTQWANRLMDANNGPTQMRMLIGRSEFNMEECRRKSELMDFVTE